MSFSAQIEKLACWRAGAWTKFDHGIMSATLRIHCDQLILTYNNRILESINMNRKIKGFCKGDVLILVTSEIGSEIRKIRFTLRSNVQECLQVLGQHFPVVNHGVQSNNSTNVICSKYRNVEEVLKLAVETDTDIVSNVTPNNFANFVKLCLLDPTFPQILQETQNIINNL